MLSYVCCVDEFDVSSVVDVAVFVVQMLMPRCYLNDDVIAVTVCLSRCGKCHVLGPSNRRRSLSPADCILSNVNSTAE